MRRLLLWCLDQCWLLLKLCRILNYLMRVMMMGMGMMLLLMVMRSVVAVQHISRTIEIRHVRMRRTQKLVLVMIMNEAVR